MQKMYPILVNWNLVGNTIKSISSIRAHTDIFSHKLTFGRTGHRVYDCILKINLYQLKIEAKMNKSNRPNIFPRNIDW